jgi:hypothetical protein
MKAEEDDQFKQQRQVTIHLLKFDPPKFQKYLAASSSKGR